MLKALSLLDDVITAFMVIGMDDRQRQQNFTCDNIVIPSKYIDFDYKKISEFVNTKLSEISKEHSCKLLYCAERSSHVWGTSHSKSDNDIKAIIYYRPKDYYSPIKVINKSFKNQYGPRDKKESKCNTDPDVELNCIELTKISQMIIRNDPNVFEIFTSPIAYYVQTPEIIDRFRDIIYATYDWYKLANHYIAWANGNFRQLQHKKGKSRVARNDLKILFVILRGILSAEWLLKYRKCEGLPLYIPDLLSFSQILSEEERKTILTLLVTKLRKGHRKIDCDPSRNTKDRAEQLIGVIDQMLHEQNPKKSGTKNEKMSIGTRINELRHESNILMGSSAAKMLEQIVFEVIESFN